jgi:hypothetical protein
MTRYYIDESGFILAEPPPEIKELQRQEQRQNQVKNLPALSRCKVCNANVKPSRMKAHLRRVHNITDTPQENKSLVAISGSETKKTVSAKPVSQTKISAIFPKNSANSDRLIECPVCKAKLNPNNLEKHRKKVHKSKNHPSFMEKMAIANDANQKTQKPIDTVKHKPIRYSSSRKKGRTGIVFESLEQSFDEKQDGSKGLGHMRRESDGKFGSFPLHDDYSEESEP